MKSDAVTMPEELLPEVLRTQPVLEGEVRAGALDDQVLAHVERRPPRAWFIAFASMCTAGG